MLVSALLFVADRLAVSSRDSKCLFTVSHTIRICAVEVTKGATAWQLLDEPSLAMITAAAAAAAADAAKDYLYSTYLSP